MISFEEIEKVLNELRCLWQDNQDMSFSDLIIRIQEQANELKIKDVKELIKLLHSLWANKDGNDDEINTNKVED